MIIILIFVILLVISIFHLRNKKEHFVNKCSEKSTPSISEIDFISPSTSTEQKKKYQIEFNLIFLNPIYSFNKEDWKDDYKKKICDDNCSCSTDNLCLISSKDSYNFLCPQTCSNCSTCLGKMKPFDKKNDKSVLDKKIKNENTIQKYNKYKERIYFDKINCNFIELNKDEKKKKLINDYYFRNKCNMFMKKPINNIYYENDDILIKIKLNNLKFENLKIKNCFLNNREKNIINIYQDNKELYILIETDVNDISECSLLLLNLNFKDKTLSKNIKLKKILNIYPKIEKEMDNEYYNNYLNEKTKIKDENEYESYLSNDYQDNYISTNVKIRNCQLNKDYSIYNPDLNLKLDTYNKPLLIDSPETWRERDDITRPWIFIG